MCCGVKFLLGSFCCLAVLAASGVVAWRFGPWYDDGSSDASDEDLLAWNTCEGCCNGLRSNCDLPANEVSYAVVHNAHSSLDDLFVGYNNRHSAEEALVAGYRGLMLDSCICDGSIGEYIQGILKGENNGDNYLGFCHTSCDAGVRNPTALLDNVKRFLDVNPNEVLILEFEINDNSLNQLSNALEQSGLKNYAYRPADVSVAWPTLRELIDANKRLILLAHGDGMESCQHNDCPDLLYTYDYIEQTNWNDDTCDVQGGPQNRKFFLMNHWMNSEADLPSEINAEGFNTYNSLVKRMQKCQQRVPNLLAVDFWDVGDVLEFVRELNIKRAGGAVLTAAQLSAEGV